MTNISMSELEVQSAELLPEKETLFLNGSWANVVASNQSMAFNVLTANSTAASGAFQAIAVTQTNN
jgi:hypothetical protein